MHFTIISFLKQSLKFLVPAANLDLHTQFLTLCDILKIQWMTTTLLNRLHLQQKFHDHFLLRDKFEHSETFCTLC